MWVYVVPAGGGVIGLALLAIVLLFGSSILYWMLTPVFFLVDLVLGLPAETQAEYLQPAIQEISTIPYQEFDEKKGTQKFIYTVDGKELLCKYGLDTSWVTGTQASFYFGPVNRIRVDRGKIVSEYAEGHYEMGRKIDVEIEAHDPASDEDNFHHIKRTYAAVPDGEWYVLVPFDDFQKEKRDLYFQEKEDYEKRIDEKNRQQKEAEDAKIRKVE